MNVAKATARMGAIATAHHDTAREQEARHETNQHEGQKRVAEQNEVVGQRGRQTPDQIAQNEPRRHGAHPDVDRSGEAPSRS